MKKAQASNQFNWLFAAIAGGVILMFFLFVIGQLKVAADAELAVEVISNFDAILTGSQVTPNTVNIIDSTKSIGLNFVCDKDGLSELNLDHSTARVDLATRIAFAADKVSGQQIFVYTLPIRQPYYAGNSMLVADQDTIFLIHNTEKKEELSNLIKLLPEEMTIEEVTGAFSKNHKSFKKIVIISSKKPSNNPDRENNPGENIFKSSNVNWIHVEFDSEGQPTIATLLKKESSEKKYTEQSKTDTREIFNDDGDVNILNNDYLLYLAFSKDLDHYECNVKKIMKRINIVAKIYKERAKILQDKVEKDKCKSLYLEAESNLDDIINNGNTQATTEALKNINKGLMISSCPLIY